MTYVSNVVFQIISESFELSRAFFARLAGWIGSDFWEDLSDRY